MHCTAPAAHPQKQQGRLPKPGLPVISALSPQLQHEWHPDNNAVLGGIKVTPGSSRKVMWSCPNCPAGRPHIWTATVKKRSRDSRRPYCHGRKVCEHSSLATIAPRQLKYWNWDKNLKTPEQILAGSNLMAEWKCPACSHKWQGRVHQRVKNDRGCPQCSRKLCLGSKQSTFKAAQHPLLLEWDHERNTNVGIHPHNTTLGSKKEVHWVCRNCPKGRLHLYQMMPSSRCGKQRRGCPYCAGRQVCKCNSLETRFPVTSSEWDFAKNDDTPAEVTSRSQQVVWWLNSVRGSWAQRINERTHPQFHPR